MAEKQTDSAEKGHRFEPVIKGDKVDEYNHDSIDHLDRRGRGAGDVTDAAAESQSHPVDRMVQRIQGAGQTCIDVCPLTSAIDVI